MDRVEAGSRDVKDRGDLVGTSRAPWQACAFPEGPVSLDHNATINTWMSCTPVL